MKRVILAGFLGIGIHLQAAGSSVGTAPTGKETAYSVVVRGANLAIWKRVEYELAPNGGRTPVEHQYIELADGLNFKDKDSKGQWAESKEQIEILPTGEAAALSGQYQAWFPADIYDGAIELLTPDGRNLKSRPLAISYDDGTKSVLVGELAHSIGQLLPSGNQIIWTNCFTDVVADLIATYRKGGFECDLVFRACPKGPEEYGLAKNARVQLLTEFFDIEEPVTETGAADPQTGLRDTMLRFGSEMRMAQGKAFSVGNADEDSPANGAVEARVFKSWERIPDADDPGVIRTVLVEELPFEQIASKLRELPAAGTARNVSPPAAGQGVGYSRSSGGSAMNHVLPPRRLAKKSDKKILLASADAISRPGYMVDWALTLNSGTSYLLCGDVTYFLSGPVTFTGTVTFEAGTVLKYASGAWLSVGGINWQAKAYRPVVFTSKNDDSVGDQVSGSTHNPTGNAYANPALSLLGLSPTLSYMRVAHAEKAITYANGTLTLNHAQIVNCNNGIISGNGAPAFLRNALFANVNYALVGASVGFSVSAENVTFAGSVNYPATFSALAAGSSPPSISLKNCILARLTAFWSGPESPSFSGNNNGFYNTPTAPAALTLSYNPPPGVNPFQSVGAGNYYLTDASNFRNVGAVNIDSTLLADLKKKTTYPPLQSSTTISTPTTWTQQALRDTTDPPNLGYHYDPLDYLIVGTATTGLTVANGVTLTLADGVAVGMSCRYGFTLNTLAGFISKGNANAMNRVAWYPSVQEQPVFLAGGSTTGMGMFTFSYNSNPSINFAFTDLPMLGRRMAFAAISPSYFSTLAFKDCWLRGVNLTVGPGIIYGVHCYQLSTVTLQNNLIERSTVSLFNGCNAVSYGGPPQYYENPLALTAYNNLFWQSTVALTYNDSLPADYCYPAWTIKDNLFDTATVSFSGIGSYINKEKNARYPSTMLMPPELSNANDVPLTTLNYASTQNGLGPWYIGSTTPSSALENVGSRTAANAGLYHHTIKSDQTKEALSQVDIGFHNVAVNGSGQPLDSDGDGFADYFEDGNGNGTYETGDFANWNDPDTDHDGMPDGWEWKNFGTFNRDGSGDFDGDRFTDAQEYAAGTDPLSRGKVILVVDSSIGANSEVSDKIDRLVTDLVGDSWHVLRHNVEAGLETPSSGDDTAWAANNAPRVREIKALIKADYDAAPKEVKAVFLIGHVPIPYSGNSSFIAGNHREMIGAHPADTFYGEMNSPYGPGGWSDLIDNDTPEYHNIPAWPGLPTIVNRPYDGKFDQNGLPSPMELGVGRIDLYHMPAFEQIGLTKEVLASHYFDRDHDFRWRERDFQVQVHQRALVAAWYTVDSVFQIDKSRLAAVSAVFGQSEVHEYVNNVMHWFGGTISVNGGHVTAEDFLIGYGGGYGSFTHAFGIGTTGTQDWDSCPTCIGWDEVLRKFAHNFVELDSRVVFENLYGSYFGHWDVENNFLRAPLANPYDPDNGRHGYGLTSVWGKWLGLDSLSLQKRALGACIGEAIFTGQTGINANYAIMGDPTLRMHNVLAPGSLSVVRTEGAVTLTWNASADPEVSGYNIYRAPTKNGPFVMVHAANAPATGITYQTARPSISQDPDNFYMVRAIKTESTLLGAYVNMSEGAIVSTPGGTIPFLRILSSPASQLVVVEGSPVVASVAFTVDAVGSEADGNQELTFEWFKNGNPNPLSDDGHFTGATSCALLIRGVQLGDAGSYYVVVSNDKGSLASAVATLTTASAP